MSEEWEVEAKTAKLTPNGEIIINYEVTHPIDSISKPEAIANAQLIAAAPELLEAAEDIVMEIGHHGFASKETLNKLEDTIRMIKEDK
jgi:hypothetical protein